MIGIGHNNPPGIVEHSNDILKEAGKWIDENPVIVGEDGAREAKIRLDRVADCIKSLEETRKKEISPFREQIAKIEAPIKEAQQRIVAASQRLKKMLIDYAATENSRRIREAETARKAAEEAEQKAREAEAREREALDDACCGVAGGNTVAASLAASQAFSEYQKAERAAQRAWRNTHVKISGGFRRAFSVRKTKELVIKDWKVAIQAIGLTVGIIQVLKKESRAYRSVNNRLPDGVEEIESEMS